VLLDYEKNNYLLIQRMLSTSSRLSTKLIIGSGVSILALWLLWKKSKNKRTEDTTQIYIRQHKVFVVDSVKQWDEILPQFLKDISSIKVVGLDCEWVQKRPVALLQLSSPCGLCVLLRLFKMAAVPPSLQELLADRSVIKVGVAVNDDSRKLHLDYGIVVAGCVDLRFVINRVRGSFKCPSRGLKGLAKGVLDLDISKDSSVRCGNWESEVYSQKQKDYAATDAAVAVDIFLKLVRTKSDILRGVNQESEESAPYPDHKSGEHPGRSESLPDDESLWKTARSMCQGLVDVPFSSNLKGGGVPVSKPPKPHKSDRPPAYAMRQRPLYDNCRLLAPDGTPLCTCDVRKAQWYLWKELADKVSDDPLTVRLRFEPSARPDTERNYYLQEKENLCVVCGHNQDYVRKFVIPYEYRKYFPSSLKDHSSHDVLLLCTPCHRRSCDYDAVLRQQLALECGAPLESGASSKTQVDRDLGALRSAGRALKHNKSSIPESRVRELEKVIKDHFGVDFVTDELLDTAALMDARHISEDYVPHGKTVVRHMVQHGGLLAFTARWRRHFTDTMSPQYLPTYWSIDFVPDGWRQQQKLQSL